MGILATALFLAMPSSYPDRVIAAALKGHLTAYRANG
jgi:hypothetical protein